MKTLIFQSHAPSPPEWITACTLSVREWAAPRGYSYKLLGDDLFQGLPPDFSRKTSSKLPLTDIGRLLWIRRFLNEGWDRVAWIDSDVLVFDPPNFHLEPASEDLVCREVLARFRDGRTEVKIAYNPTILAFNRGSPMIEELCKRSMAMAKRAKAFSQTMFGRDLLHQAREHFPSASIDNVGHFNQGVIREILDLPHEEGRDAPRVEPMIKTAGNPFAAANLCAHHDFPPDQYLVLVNLLLETRGDVVNSRL